MTTSPSSKVVRPLWIDSPNLPEAERKGLQAAHELLVETGVARWEK